MPKDFASATMSMLMSVAIVWFVFTTQRSLSELNAHLANIEERLPDPGKPTIVTVPGMQILASALRAPCKEPHKQKEKQ